MADDNELNNFRNDIVDDWKNREFIITIVNLITNFTNKLNHIAIMWETKLKIMTQKLESITKKIEYLENQIKINNLNYNDITADDYVYDDDDDDDFD